VQLLLEAGVDKEVKNKFGATALMFASQWGRTGIVNLLLKAGADKEAKNKNGKTALDYARINHRTEATALLED
jgi:ankyrin repeat protein